MKEKGTACLICGKGYLRPAKVKEEMYGIGLGTYNGEVCDNPECGESYLKAGEMDRMVMRARELGLWGLEARVKLGKSGNSLILRIPARLVRFLELEPGRDVFLAPEGKNKLVMEPE